MHTHRRRRALTEFAFGACARCTTTRRAQNALEMQIRLRRWRVRGAARWVKQNKMGTIEGYLKEYISVQNPPPFYDCFCLPLSPLSLTMVSTEFACQHCSGPAAPRSTQNTPEMQIRWDLQRSWGAAFAHTPLTHTCTHTAQEEPPPNLHLRRALGAPLQDGPKTRLTCKFGRDHGAWEGWQGGRRKQNGYDGRLPKRL